MNRLPFSALSNLNVQTNQIGGKGMAYNHGKAERKWKLWIWITVFMQLFLLLLTKSFLEIKIITVLYSTVI